MTELTGDWSRRVLIFARLKVKTDPQSCSQQSESLVLRGFEDNDLNQLL
jgi:hypothetical protein